MRPHPSLFGGRCQFSCFEPTSVSWVQSAGPGAASGGRCGGGPLSRASRGRAHACSGYGHTRLVSCPQVFHLFTRRMSHTSEGTRSQPVTTLTSGCFHASCSVVMVTPRCCHGYHYVAVGAAPLSCLALTCLCPNRVTSSFGPFVVLQLLLVSQPKCHMFPSEGSPAP